MYGSDYQMSLGSSALDYVGVSNKATLLTGWIHPNNNDVTKSVYEWTISRYGKYSGNYFALRVNSDGRVNENLVTNSRGVLPVFYLTNNVTYRAGAGTYAEPFIINE